MGQPNFNRITIPILSSLLFFSTLLVDARKKNDVKGNGSVRGGVPERNSPRNLIDINDMVCEPVDDGIGSQICTFRIVPPKSTSDAKLSSTNCMRSSSSPELRASHGDGEFCIDMEIYRRITSNDEKEDPSVSLTENDQHSLGVQQQFQTEQQSQPPPPPPLTTTVTTAETAQDKATKGSHNGNAIQQMVCPRNAPQSRSECKGWLPVDATFASCTYYDSNGMKTCTCQSVVDDGGRSRIERSSGPSVIQWDCGDTDLLFEEATFEQQQEQQHQQQQKQREPLYDPRAANDSIGSKNEQVITNIKEGTIPKPINDPLCPPRLPMPADGTTCNMHQRCGYWDQNPYPTKIIDCKCSNELKFVCMDAEPELYSYYYGSF